MTTSVTTQQSKMLQIAPEIRKIFYSHLFWEPSREVRFYRCHDGLEIIPGLPAQVLRVCHRIHDEASSMIEESLSRARLKVEHCGKIQPHDPYDGPETPIQD